LNLKGFFISRLAWCVASCTAGEFSGIFGTFALLRNVVRRRGHDVGMCPDRLNRELAAAVDLAMVLAQLLGVRAAASYLAGRGAVRSHPETEYR